MSYVKGFVTEIGVASLLGASIFVARNFAPKECADELLAQAPHLRGSPLAQTVLAFKDLRCGCDMQTLIQECDALVAMSTGEQNCVLGYQFRANRQVTDIMRICKRMCDKAKRSGDNERIDAAIICLRDYEPQLESACKAYLQNMLM